MNVAELYGSHHGWLTAWLRRKLGCPHGAADLAQDTFLRVLHRPEREEMREPRAYLASIAHGLLVDHLRRRDLERAYLDELALLPEPLHPSPEELALVTETLRAVDRLLDGLSTKTRTAFLYSRLDGLTHGEIAALLSVSVPRVRQYLATAARRCYVARFGEPVA